MLACLSPLLGAPSTCVAASASFRVLEVADPQKVLRQADLNVFHGRTPAVSDVKPGGPEDAGHRGDGRALFLCYPPFGDAIGARCLEAFRCVDYCRRPLLQTINGCDTRITVLQASKARADHSFWHRGSTVCILGEWRGHTGDDDLAALLLRDFTLVQSVDVPNWTDTAHELTVWRRRDPQSAGSDELSPQDAAHVEVPDSARSKDSTTASLPHSGHSGPAGDLVPMTGGSVGGCGGNKAATRDQRLPLQCWTCGNAQRAVSSSATLRRAVSSTETADDRPGLRRCRYCRNAAFCSAFCAAKGEGLHRQAHALRLIFFKDHQPDFSSDADFEPVPTL